MPARVLILRGNPVPPDPRVEKIARALSGLGYGMRILAWDKDAQHPLEDALGGIGLSRIGLRLPRRRGAANLPYLALFQARLMGWLARRRAEYDLIHACDFDTLLPALAAKRLWGKRVIYDIFDFYADMLRRTPAWLAGLARRAELWALGRADAVILADEARQGQIAGSHPRRLAFIYNSPAEEGLPAAAGEASPAGELRIAYVGNLQRERGLNELFEVLERHPEWHLDLAGFGPDAEAMARRASALPNAAWHGRIPYERALELEAAADVLLATYDPRIPNNRYASPNKVFEAMLLGKPVVVARGTNADRLVQSEGSGMVVDYGSAAALEAAFQELAASPELRARLGRNGCRAYRERYSWEIMRSRLAALYAEVAA